LEAELGRLDLVLHREVLLVRGQNEQIEPFSGLYVADEQVDALLAGARQDSAAAEALAVEIDAATARLAARVRASGDLPLARLARVFGLDRPALDMLLLAVAPELDARSALLYAYVQNDVTQRRPTVELALRLLSTTFRERLDNRRLVAPDGPLASAGLVRVLADPQDREPPLTARFLKADERIVGFLSGASTLDPRLSAIGGVLDDGLPLAELAVKETARERLESAAAVLAPGWAVSLHGPAGVGKRAAAGALARRLGMPLLAIDLRRAPSETSLEELAGAARRECALSGAALYLGGADALEPARIAGALDNFPSPVIVGTAEPWPAAQRLAAHMRSIRLELPSFGLRERLWRSALGGDADGVDLADLAARFVLSPRQIEDAVRTARDDDGHGLSDAALHAAARGQSTGGLARLATRIDPVYGWDDIVLPRPLIAELRDVRATIRNRHVVHERWGFGERLSLGKGTHVLFSGPSGTGKTMAAEVIARDLELDLYKVDLATVVSKYIGETEKHLREIFAEARAGNAIVFLDECDALLGKRSKVRDAHDRYANIEVAFLLQQLEEHEGTVILATNFAENVDPAFVRRMHHALEFPAPNAELRAEIWRRMFPRKAPLADDVDLAFLAERFEITGGNIRNIAMAAAFLAADGGGPIAMRHLIRATARELHKLGRLPTQADFGDHFAAAVQMLEGTVP
jgi:AAA+ superfamily predicted ATPase